MSKRDDIINSILTDLALIKQSSGYNFDVQLIDENLKDPDALTADQFPALFVIDSDETKDDATVSELKNELKPIIIGYIKCPDDTYKSKVEVRKLLEDVEKALCSNRYRTGLAINTLPSSIKTDHGFNPPYGIFEFIFKITYLQEYGTP